MAEWVSAVMRNSTSSSRVYWVPMINSVQLYSCPVKCTVAKNQSWFPCGSSSAVSVAARVHGHNISIDQHKVGIDGQTFQLAEGQAVNVPGVTAERLFDKHPTEKPLDDEDSPRVNTHVNKDKILITIENKVTIETWQFYNKYMPTGFLTNIKLTLPGEASVHKNSMCSAYAANASHRALRAAEVSASEGEDHDEVINKVPSDRANGSVWEDDSELQDGASPPRHSSSDPVPPVVTRTEPASSMTSPNIAWLPATLATLEGQCNSFSGEYSIAKSSIGLCKSSGFSTSLARKSCSQFADSGASYDACLTDVCGLSSIMIADMHNMVQDDVKATAARNARVRAERSAPVARC
jgi:hypothetical protein